MHCYWSHWHHSMFCFFQNHVKNGCDEGQEGHINLVPIGSNLKHYFLKCLAHVHVDWACCHYPAGVVLSTCLRAGWCLQPFERSWTLQDAVLTSKMETTSYFYNTGINGCPKHYNVIFSAFLSHCISVKTVVNVHGHYASPILISCALNWAMKMIER